MALTDLIHIYLERFRSGKLCKPHQCAVCGAQNKLQWHGQYQRKLITPSEIHSIPVKRLFCSLCHHTFALIPSFVIKFHRYAKQTIQSALRMLKTLSRDRVASWLMEQGIQNIAALTLYFWRRKFA